MDDKRDRSVGGLVRCWLAPPEQAPKFGGPLRGTDRDWTGPDLRGHRQKLNRTGPLADADVAVFLVRQPNGHLGVAGGDVLSGSVSLFFF